MNNDYEIREQILAQALEELKQKAGAVIESIMSDLYSDYLPHVVSDTDANISYRVEGCINNILQGKIQLVDGHPDVFYVNDRYRSDHHISLSHYFDWKLLCDSLGETIQTNRIKQLEQEVQSLKQQLQDSYRRY
jgi:hypothetical protein